MTTTVTLGLVKLEAFEIPTTIAFGGKQRLAIHDLPGGGRVVDVLGGTDTDITFGGIISGSDADTRAQLLDALRISGASLPLSWAEQYFIVIISEADFDYRKPWWIPYRLRCVVQSNLRLYCCRDGDLRCRQHHCKPRQRRKRTGRGSGDPDHGTDSPFADRRHHLRHRRLRPKRHDAERRTIGLSERYRRDRQRLAGSRSGLHGTRSGCGCNCHDEHKYDRRIARSFVNSASLCRQRADGAAYYRDMTDERHR